MDDVSGQSNDSFNSGIFQCRIIGNTVRSNDAQPGFGAGVYALDICLAAKCRF